MRNTGRVGLIGFYNPQILDGQDVGLCEAKVNMVKWLK